MATAPLLPLTSALIAGSAADQRPDRGGPWGPEADAGPRFGLAGVPPSGPTSCGMQVTEDRARPSPIESQGSNSTALA
jgi:hypothetical protein